MTVAPNMTLVVPKPMATKTSAKWIFARRGEPEQAAEAGDSEEAVADQKPAYPDTVEQRRADNTTQDATDTLRDGDETGRQRRIVQHVLAVHADDENLGRRPRPDEPGHDVTTDERAVVEGPAAPVDPAALLVAHEGDQTHDAPDQTSDEGSGEPVVSCADRRGEDQQGGRRRHHRRAEQIEAPAAFLARMGGRAVRLTAMAKQSGTLTKNTPRHPTVSTSTPPATSPTTKPTDAVMP